MLTLASCTAETGDGADQKDSATPAADIVTKIGAFTFNGPAPKNVIMVSIDTLERSRVGRYSGGTLTPRLDALAESAFVLDDHASCSAWTYSSINCALTGRYNQELGYEPQVGEADTSPLLPEGVTTLAQTMRDAGFHTRLLSTNGLLSETTDTARGYDEIDMALDVDAAGVTQRVLDEVDSLVEPFLLHVHYMDPHMPYAPPPAYVEAEVDGLRPVPWDLSTKEGMAAARDAWNSLNEADRANLLAWWTVLYEGELKYTDESVGALLDGLDAAGKLADSLVVLWSDHGEEFFEHGALGHGVQLHNDQADSVALFWSPAIVPVAYDKPSSHVDLAPTVLQLLSVAAPAEMSGSVMGTPGSGARFAFLWTKENTASASVERGKLKLLYSWRGDKEFYDRSIDEAEAHDHYTADDPDIVALWALLEPRVRSEADLVGLEPIALGP